MRVNVQQQPCLGLSPWDHLLLGARLVIFTLSSIYSAVDSAVRWKYPADFYRLSTFGQMRENTIGIISDFVLCITYLFHSGIHITIPYDSKMHLGGVFSIFLVVESLHKRITWKLSRSQESCLEYIMKQLCLIAKGWWFLTPLYL